MRKTTQLPREQLFLRIGAVCAILGAIVSVTAGTSFGNITNELGIEAVLRYLAALPTWYWPTVQLGFIVGALLWSVRSPRSPARSRAAPVGLWADWEPRA